MKKLLLPLCFLAAGAVNANADDVLFEDNFNWLAPWVTEHELGDPVGTNNPDAKGVSITASSMIGTWGGNIFHEMMDPSIVVSEELQYAKDGFGYQTRIFDGLTNSSYWCFYAYDSYIRVGSAGFNAGIRTPNISIPTDVTELYLEFDWCPCKADDGCWHFTVLDVQYRPGNLTVADDLEHPNADDDNKPFAWKHECIDLLAAGATGGEANPKPGQGCNVVIEASKSWGLQAPGEANFYLDNIRISTSKLPAAVTDVIVDNDRTQPVEYYTLQGIRVNNPENGIFIRRQGKSVTKVVK